MVKSIENYKLWKEELKEEYYEKFPKHKKKVDEFVDYISLVYDKFQRVYLPKKVMWYIYWKKRWTIKNNQHFWIGVIGRKGGEGKSTLLHHILYFLDQSYTPNRDAMEYYELLKIIRAAKKEVKYPSVLLDEPDNRTHQLSKKGKHIKDILERIRQLNLFVGVCANSLTSIPTFIYERLSVIISIDSNHRFNVWDNEKDKPKHSVVDDIKGVKGWGELKHSVFSNKKFLRRSTFLNQTFSPDSPFDLNEYLEKKEVDLMNTLDSFLVDYKKDDSDSNEGETAREKKIMAIEKARREKSGISDAQLGFKFGYTGSMISKLSKIRFNQLREQYPLYSDAQIRTMMGYSPKKEVFLKKTTKIVESGTLYTN